jgi:hypothetical protein
MKTFYESVIQDHLTPRRFRQFENLTVTHNPNGETVLTGLIPDQSALLGLLNWLHDLGAVLISVRRLEEKAHGSWSAKPASSTESSESRDLHRYSTPDTLR